ncbi:zinc finger protein CONSTANS-LIKE 16-like [Rutidosis leptorrhynchoides]|uniref:zinc finger protein CONSTANS-LIKE 16-like n=1 Tax=Rutidosis leptorrhynchoides TaxID=125765 RepID=UPI003A99EE95
MLTAKKTSNVVGGKTARACDSCVRNRARWYCDADDAFLCQNCDGSVHSANQLAGRHERVLLESAPSKLFGSSDCSPEPTWHQGLTRRARTPRSRSKSHSFKLKGKRVVVKSFVPLVPELGVLEASLFDEDEEEEQLLYRVPVFDPFETELCNASIRIGSNLSFILENKQEQTCNLDDLQGFDLPTDDMELLEFAAGAGSLSMKGFDNTSCRIGELGLTSDHYNEEDDTNNIGFCFEENEVKVEEANLGFDVDVTRETLDWEFGYDSPMTIKEEDKNVVIRVEEEHIKMVTNDQFDEKVEISSLNLRLNYEDVIRAWADQGSLWTNGARPQLNSDCWHYFMDLNWTGSTNRSYGGVGGSDGGREARVSRYREKRRKRLFSKKIRYQVRKLNAEKRPRMKGRFVKRDTFG